MRASAKNKPRAALPETTAPSAGWAWGFLALLALYLALWAAAPLRSLGPIGTGGDFLQRFELLVRLLYPEDLLGLWFGGFSLRGLADRVPIVALASLIVVGATGLGDLALRCLTTRARLTRWERLVIAATLGLNVVSMATLLLTWGTAPAIQKAGLWALLFAGIGGSLALAWRDRRLAAAEAGRFWTKLDLLLIPPAAILLAGGLLPPTDFDVREYHLQAPREFFEWGGLEFLPHNVYANMPLGAEMYALAAMRMTGQVPLGALAGKLILAAFPLLTALALKTAGARWMSPEAGSAAAILYLATPWVLGLTLNGLIETALAHYLMLTVMLAVDALYLAQHARERAELLGLAGFAAGAAAATKYPGALFGIALPALGIALLARGARWRVLLVFIACAGLGSAPWYVKNFALTGNPTYPLLAGVFGAAGRAPEDQERWQRAHRADSYSLADLANHVVDFAGRSEYHSPLLAPLALVGFAASRRRREALVLAGYIAALFACWWLLTHRIDRFWTPVLPLVAWLAGYGAEWLWARLRAPIVAALLAGAMGWGCLVAAGGVMAYDRFLADLQACWRDPQRVPEWITRLNRETPPGKRVLAEGDAAVFDLPPRTVYHTAFDRSPLADLVFDRPAEAARRALAEREIALVYLNWAEIARYRQPGNYGYDERITPELLSRLVRDGVLAAPWTEFREQGVEIYPVVPPEGGASIIR